MSTAILLYLVNTVIRGAAAALIVVLLETLLRRKLVFSRGRIVYGVLLLAVLLPFEYLPATPGRTEIDEEKSWRHIQLEASAMDFSWFGEAAPVTVVGGVSGAEAAPAQAPARNWVMWALSGYGMIAAFLSAKQICRYCIGRGRVRRCVAITSGRVWDAFRESKRLAGMEHVPVALLDGGGWLPTAACFGTRFGGAVLCPRTECEMYSVQQLKMILIHELGHLRRYDNPAAFLLTMLGNIFFLNPFLKIAANRWCLIAELDCDERVGQLLQLDKAGLSGYAGLLLDFQLRSSPESGGGAHLGASAKTLKLRIRELAMKRSKWKLAGIFAGIVGIFALSMSIVPELSAAEKSKGEAAQFDASILNELPSNRVTTLYINGTLIDDAGLSLLRKMEVPKVLPGPFGQMVDMALLAAETRAITYTGAVQKADGNESGGYTVVQSARPETMAEYERYNREKFGNIMEVKKLGRDTFASYLRDLPYEFNAAQKSDMTVNPDDVFCAFDAVGKRQIVVRLVDGQYLVSLLASVPSLEKGKVTELLFKSLNDRGNDAEAVAAYIKQFVSTETVSEADGCAEMRINLVLNDSLAELIEPFLVKDLQRQYNGVPPEVTATFPVNGATGVDPATNAITVTFDRPMNRNSYAFCTKGIATFPETTSKPFYNVDGTIVVLPVKLKPDTTYDIYLNLEKLLGFFSAEGGLLKDYHYTFTTGSGK